MPSSFEKGLIHVRDLRINNCLKSAESPTCNSGERVVYRPAEGAGSDASEPSNRRLRLGGKRTCKTTWSDSRPAMHPTFRESALLILWCDNSENSGDWQK